MKRKFLTLGIALAMVATLVVPSAVLAVDPTVSITVSAKTISITNTQDTWAIGAVVVDDVKYFSADNTQNDTYSQIENTGNVAVDVEIRGITIEGGAYDWTLATAAGDQIYSLYANKAATPTVYDVEVKSSAYNDITAAAGLAAAGTNAWSMKFTAPTAFHASDAGAQKSATVTLVASEHT